jgi:multiple sugar transport system permease protein
MTEDRLRAALLAAGAILLLVFCLAPFVYMAIMSVSARSDVLARGVPFEWTLQHYRSILFEPTLSFPAYFRNSLGVAGLSAIIGTGVAALAAFAITRLNLPGKNFLLLFTLAASLFPQISFVGYLFSLMARLGWINTWAALIAPYVAWILPLSLWILASYFGRIPRELDKAAWVDGAGAWRIFWRIILPLSAPGIVSALLLSFIFAFNEFLFALLLTTGPQARTIPVGIALFQGAHGQTPWGEIMAASMATALPVVLLALFFQRRIVQGLTRGAVKG